MNDQNQEPLKEGKQSDGSWLNIPKSLIPDGHEHYLTMDPGERFAKCDCGFGGAVYPHNARIIDGHVYNLEGKKII